MQTLLRFVDLSSVAVAALAGLVTLFLLEIFRFYSTKSRFPPGPKPLPFVGNMIDFVKNPMAVIKSTLQYGEMCTLYVGRRPMIVLNNLDVVKEALVDNGASFSGRPHIPIIQWITRGYGILAVTSNSSWKQQRRFALHTLRNFGLGKKSLEERVTEEARCLIKELLKQEGKKFNPIHPFMNAVSNIICSTVFGDRFEYDDERFARLLAILNENVSMAGSAVGVIFNLFPFIKHFPGPQQKVYRNALALVKFICDFMEEHKETLDPENPRDFIDAYLVEMKKNVSKEGNSFCEENLLFSTSDLFLAGTETTATTLRWALIYMMEYPEVQERCHEEIIRVLGYDRAPSMDDRPNLPYTLATVYEIQRYGNIVPLGVTHQTTQPATLRGVSIPEGTEIASNLMAIMRDKRHWKHPDTFNPENFLDKDGQFVKHDHFLAFSLGPRVCLGETLARSELFIFFTSLLQRLKFTWPSDHTPIDMDGNMSLVRMTPPFQIICHSRECSTPSSTSKPHL